MKELRRRYDRETATLSGLRRISFGILTPGFQGKPWADISQRFQRYSIPPAGFNLILSCRDESATRCAKPRKS
jgi:hypothetical protein